MRLAQDLYEGIEIGEEGAVGLITYMRTDSTRVAPSAVDQARDYIKMMYGQPYLPDAPRLYSDGKSKNAQDAHEAIRPTDPTRRPEHIRKYLKEDQYRLYELIWQRFMASQMSPAIFDTTTVDFDLGRFLFRATGSVDIKVAPGRVRVDTALVAIPTSASANITTTRLAWSRPNSENSASRAHETPYTVSTVMNVAVHCAALNFSGGTALNRRAARTTATLAAATRPAQPAAT